MPTIASELASYMADEIDDECPERCREAIRMAFCNGAVSALWLAANTNQEPAAIAAQAVHLHKSVMAGEL